MTIGKARYSASAVCLGGYFFGGALSRFRVRSK